MADAPAQSGPTTMPAATEPGGRLVLNVSSDPANLAPVRRACEASLHRLSVDTIDLYQVHRPDIFAHPESIAATLLTLRDEGKIRAIGISNHTPAQHDAMRAFLGDALATTQPQYSAAELGPLRFTGPLPCSRCDPRW